MPAVLVDAELVLRFKNINDFYKKKIAFKLQLEGFFIGNVVKNSWLIIKFKPV